MKNDNALLSDCGICAESTINVEIINEDLHPIITLRQQDSTISSHIHTILNKLREFDGAVASVQAITFDDHGNEKMFYYFVKASAVAAACRLKHYSALWLY